MQRAGPVESTTSVRGQLQAPWAGRHTQNAPGGGGDTGSFFTVTSFTIFLFFCRVGFGSVTFTCEERSYPDGRASFRFEVCILRLTLQAQNLSSVSAVTLSIRSYSSLLLHRFQWARYPAAGETEAPRIKLDLTLLFGWQCVISI